MNVLDLELEYSVIYSADWNPQQHRVADFMPPNRRLWDQTEGDEQGESDYLGWTRHRKWCALLTQDQFDEFVDKCGLHAEDCETMGSIGAPGFGWGWAPAISFDGDHEQGAWVNAYVTPIPKGEPPEDWDPEAAWELLRRKIIDQYRF